MSEQITDEQLQAIENDWCETLDRVDTNSPDWTEQDAIDALAAMRLALRQRDSTIAALRTDVATLREQIGGLIGEREDLIERERDRGATIDELRTVLADTSVRATQAQLVAEQSAFAHDKLLLELAELRKPVEESEVIDLAALVEQIAAYNCSLTEEQTQKLYRCASLLQTFESQVYQLRNPGEFQ